MNFTLPSARNAFKKSCLVAWKEVCKPPLVGLSSADFPLSRHAFAHGILSATRRLRCLEQMAKISPRFDSAFLRFLRIAAAAAASKARAACGQTWRPARSRVNSLLYYEVSLLHQNLLSFFLRSLLYWTTRYNSVPQPTLYHRSALQLEVCRGLFSYFMPSHVTSVDDSAWVNNRGRC